MFSSVIKNSNDVLYDLSPKKNSDGETIELIIDVPNLILLPKNELLQSNTLKIRIGSNIIDNSIVVFIITIGIKQFIIRGKFIINGITNYPSITNILDSSGLKAFIPGEYGFVIELQDVLYKFVRHSLTWDFFLAVERVPKKVGSNGENDLNATQYIITKFQQPELFIISQLLIDDSDIGDTLFEVKNNGITQNYEKYCPKIVSVLKGIGLTAYDKLSYIYKTENISILGLEFLYNMIEYGMVRYLLSKLLYDKFNIKYLLDKYYIKFIKDLKNSEYKNFVNYFIDPHSKVYNYNKYFLCTI